MNDNSKVIIADINDILPNRFQPRIQFDENEILELSDSIKVHGIIQPIVVRPVGDKWEIVAGERRYKAAVLAGLDQVPIISKNLSDKDSAEIALIENIQRKNLTPIEEALSYKKILDMGYVTQEALANKVGKSQPSIANKIRLLNLSDEVQEALLENKISERHARSLLRLKESKDQNYMLNKIITERLTVRKTDEEIQKYVNNKEKGEINMNNNQTPNFDIFGQPQTTPQEQSSFQTFQQPQQAQQEQPSFNIFDQSTTVNPIQQQNNSNEPQSVVQPNFDIFGQPQTTPTPVAPTPIVEQPQPQMTVENNNTFGFGPIEQPAQAPEVPVSTPVIETPVEQPAAVPPIQSNGFAFDSNGTVVANSTSTVEQPSFNIFDTTTQVEEQKPTIPSFNIFDQSSAPTSDPQVASAPVTSPIVEQPQPQMTVENNNTFGFGPIEAPVQAPEVPVSTPVIETPVEQPAAVPPIQPIIVTDYNKQYDPIMPQDTVAPAPVVDFKEVIKAIRECSEKIENYGFKIDVEEYDLENLYQAVFKIEKK